MTRGQKLPGMPDPMHMWPGARGVELAADSWGDPEGPLVLLQHGGGQTRHAWKRTGELLGDAGYRAAAFDARGHGDSDWATDGVYGPDIMVEDLCQVIDHLGRKSAVLVGASMGGVTSLIAVGDGKVDPLALVLVDIAPRIEIPGLRKIQGFMTQKPEGFDSLEEVAQTIASYQPHRSARQVSESVAKNVRLHADGKYRWHWDPRYRASMPPPEKRLERLEAAARRLAAPTLLVRGGLSDVLSEEGAQSFLALCPHSEYVNVKDAAHMVAGDRNDVFAASVIDFLRRVVPR